MKNITIPFGGRDITFKVSNPNLIEVLGPKRAKPIEDLERAIASALADPLGQPPLHERVKPKDRVLIVCDDGTRLTPAERLLPPLLEALNGAGVPDRQVSIIMALGTHRPMTEREILNKVGREIYGRVSVYNHDWEDPGQLVDMGVSKHGTPVQVNRSVQDANLIIGLGTIVPHHISGFSGSSKIIQPGICGAVTTGETHLLSTQTDDSLLGVENNPVRQDMDDMAERVGMDTILNVVLNTEGLVVGLFFGEMRTSFAHGVRLAESVYGVHYNEMPDIVIANSCPCDLDFWQSHKSLYPAARMVKKGGSIVIVSPAPEGVSPVHTSLLNFTSWSASEIEAAYRYGEIKDGVAAALAIAWAKVRQKAQVIMVSPGISPEEKVRLGFVHAEGIEGAIGEAYKRQGGNARMTILTHAPEVLPIKDF